MIGTVSRHNTYYNFLFIFNQSCAVVKLFFLFYDFEIVKPFFLNCLSFFIFEKYKSLIIFTVYFFSNFLKL